ncbi:MAG: phosphoribosylanthranilate isomerase [Clostridiales bacterium]|jgi:phosphoribosylanthranilate isomerase|nr:phosphoribosylanthranilate isomerase [Clostridiales bacterium]
MTRVKICGIKNIADGLVAARAGADAIGLVFANSPRKIDLETARAICTSLPPFVTRVGVFVNEDGSVVNEIAAFCGLTALQFHGDEDAQYCRQFSLPVLKSISVRTAQDLRGIEEFPAAAFVLDTYHPIFRGGTGETFDWSLLDNRPNVPIILAGGLTPENLAEAIRRVKPYGVDVSSGVETDGKKDQRLIQAFIEEAGRCS